MKFSKVIGKIDPKLIQQAEEKLSRVFLQLGTRYDNDHVGDGMGGDPLIFTLMYPVEHIATMNIGTAGTDGKRYYWNPKFILKFPQKSLGLRIVCAHEAWHAIYMHPSRRGSRNPRLWNIAVDYIVNGTVMDDFKARKRDGEAEFTKHLGRYIPLDTLALMMKNPYAKIPGFEDIYSGIHDPQNPSKDVKLPGPMEDRELTAEEKAELEKRESGAKYFYADPALPDDMKSPEKIYEMLYKLLPKCPKCGMLGIYPKPQSGNQKQKGKGKKDKNEQGEKGEGEKEKQEGKGDQQHDHEHGEGEPCDCEGKGDGQGDQGGQCDHGGDGVDIFGLGGTLDDHMDSEESEEKMAKRISEAMEAAKKMAGHVPAALEDELGKLTAPKVTWQDIIRTRLCKSRQGNQKNDWTRFKTRPMFSGLLVPKRRSYHARFGVLLDTSGSMSGEDIAFGVSQLQSLDDKGEGIITPADAEIYYDQSTVLKKCNAEELSKVKIVGRGGTVWASYFDDYEKEIGKCDFLIIISDLYLCDQDVANMKNPGIPVFWLCTSTNSNWNPPFGKVMPLRND